MDLKIDDHLIDKAVEEKVKTLGLIPKDQLLGKTIGIDEFRKRYCGGKAKSWVRYFVFDQHPEVAYPENKDGWVIAPRKTSGIRSTVIFEYPAAKWMEDHRDEIDWFGRLEK